MKSYASSLLQSDFIKPKAAPIAGVALLFTLYLCINFSSNLRAQEGWQQVFGSAQHTSFSNETLNPSQVSERWRSSAFNGFHLYIQPVLSYDGSKVFTFASSGQNQSKILALDSFTGKLIWEKDVAVVDVPFGGLAFHEGYLYLVGSDGGATTRLHKLNVRLNGSTEAQHGGWIVDFPQEFDGQTSPLTIANKMIFFSLEGTSQLGFGIHRFGRSTVDGTTGWVKLHDGPDFSAFCFDPARNQVFQIIADNGLKLRAYDANTGDTNWTSTWTFAHTPKQNAIVLGNDRVYVCDSPVGNGTDAKLYVADAVNGNLLHSPDIPGTGTCTPALNGIGDVFVMGSNGIRGFDSNGNILWTSNLVTAENGQLVFWDNFLLVHDDFNEQLHFLKNLQNGQTPVIEKTMQSTGAFCMGPRTYFHFDTATHDLVAYASSSDFATEVIASDNGTSGDFDKPEMALGRPTIDTVGDGVSINPNWKVPVNPSYPPFKNTEVFSVGTSGSITLKFDHPVRNDINNPYGIDLLAFGNALQSLNSGAWTAGDPNLVNLTSGLFSEAGQIEISQDGQTWTPVSETFDGFPATLGRVYDDVNPDTSINDPVNQFTNLYWGQPTDATLPLDPALMPSSFNGKTLREVADLYQGSAGGTGIDIGAYGFEWIQFVRLSNNSNAQAPEVDAISDVRIDLDLMPPPEVTNATQTTNALTWTNPTVEDFAGVLVFQFTQASVLGDPVDGVSYKIGDQLGDFEIVFVGNTENLSLPISNQAIPRYKIITYDQMLNYSEGVELQAQDDSDNPLLAVNTTTLTVLAAGANAVTAQSADGNTTYSVNQNGSEWTAIIPTASGTTEVHFTATFNTLTKKLIASIERP